VNGDATPKPPTCYPGKFQVKFWQILTSGSLGILTSQGQSQNDAEVAAIAIIAADR